MRRVGPSSPDPRVVRGRPSGLYRDRGTKRTIGYMRGLVAATAVLGVIAIGGLPVLALTLADAETGTGGHHADRRGPASRAAAVGARPGQGRQACQAGQGQGRRPGRSRRRGRRRRRGGRPARLGRPRRPGAARLGEAPRRTGTARLGDAGVGALRRRRGSRPDERREARPGGRVRRQARASGRRRPGPLGVQQPPATAGMTEIWTPSGVLVSSASRNRTSSLPT